MSEASSAGGSQATWRIAPRLSALRKTAGVTLLRGGSPAAVDPDRLSGDEPGLIGGEVGDHRGDFIRLAEAADRDRFRSLAEAHFEVVAIFAAVGADRPRGADRAGANRVDGDPE